MAGKMNNKSSKQATASNNGNVSSDNRKTDNRKKKNVFTEFIEKLQPRLLNLMNEFTDAEMFLVDGDSLFLHLILDQNLDWYYGGQLLHLVYLCERYLHLFTRKGAVFQLVFFRDHEELWRSDPSLLLARQSLKIHLSENIKFKVLCDFHNPWDSAFEKYVREFCPSFILLSDGFSEELSLRPFHLPGLVCELFLCQLNTCLNLGINCAFTSGIRFSTSTLDGYHVTPNRNYGRKPALLAKGVFRNLCSYNASDCNVNSDVVNEVLKHCKSYFSNDDEIDVRLFIHCATACIYLKLYSGQTSTSAYYDLVRVVLLHAVLLTQLPLAYRSLSFDDDNIIDDDIQSNFLQSFKVIQKMMCQALDYFPAQLPEKLKKSKISICDVWDGRLLFKLLLLLLTNKRSGKDITLSNSTHEKFVCLLDNVTQMCDTEIQPFPILSLLGNGDNLLSEVQTIFKLQSNKRDEKSSTLSEREPYEPRFKMEGLVKVDCSLLNEYAGEIRDNPSLKLLEADDPGVVDVITSDEDFDETYHWHSGKPLSDDYERTKDNKQQNDKWAMRGQAKFATFMHRYGASLLGESPSPPIVVGDKKNTKQTKTSSKAQKIIDENNKKKEETNSKKDEDKWLGQEPDLKRLINEKLYDDALFILKNRLGNISHGKTILKILMMKAMISWKKWCESKSKKDVELCFLAIQEILENYKENIDKKDKKALVQYLNDFGFGDIAIKNGLTNELPASKEEDIGISSARYQLQNIGHQLKRTTCTDRDPRVDKFIPEAWQRELLDAVDNKQSALIVAPTSSGKTYVSFYCMEKILREDNEGVVIYVSPTKALVNQVAATCYVRYQKEMPPGKALYGVFTRDYRNNALNCQILITVPQCLEILLLSPARQDWVAKIKYVIFDEVHCIGSEIGAEVWEHLLLLIRSPYLALSATIHNPKVLHQWLQTAENEKRKRDLENNCPRENSPESYEVALVMYDERYNDLEKFNYVEESDDTPGTLKHIHPCSMLTLRQLARSDVFPSHISLSPRESLALYDAMLQCWPDKGTLQNLSPEFFFKEYDFISKQDAKDYEKCLKKEFVTWVSDRERFEKVIGCLGGTIYPLPTNNTKSFAIENVVELLEQLDKENKLPVICFSYDRVLCEDLAKKIVSHLEEKEQKIRANEKTSSSNTKKKEQQNAKREKRQRDNQIDEDKTRKSSASGYGSGYHKQRSNNTRDDNCFLFDDPPEEGCSYAGQGVLDKEDANVIVRKLGQSKVDTSPFKSGLRRGVSYHHAGMSSLQRRIVEMLFRKKFLRVVFATGTLALGIHMPCKTVVLATDSVFLNTLQYHQISGRAGRRGYDLLGEVIFFGIPQAKIQRLMTVHLARIIGNFPLNVTLVLRLLLMINKAGDPRTAMNQVITMLQNPLICQDQPELDLQLKHHFLFSVDLLVRQGLLGVNGNPQGLAGLATHLHYHEPGNLVFVSFLQKGLFHELCKNQRSPSGKYSKDLMKSLVVILSHLFTKRNLHRFLLSQPRSTSKLILEKLPPLFQEGLESYNNIVHEVFDLYLRTVAVHVFDTMGEDVTLPLSEYKCISSKNYQPSADTATGTINGTVNTIATSTVIGTVTRTTNADIAVGAATTGTAGGATNGTVTVTDTACGGVNGAAAVTDSVTGSDNTTFTVNASLNEPRTETLRDGPAGISSGVTVLEDCTLEEQFIRSSLRSKACSAFAALSGHTDTGLYSSEDLISNIRYQVYTDVKVVPILEDNDDLNSYAFDFFNHENQKAIIEENGIQGGEVFQLLKDFMLVVKSISVSLTELAPEDDDVVIAFQQLANDYSAKFKKAFNLDPF